MTVAQYDVYPNPSARSRDEVPFIVDIQSELLSDLRTRLVMPLSPTGATLTQAPRRLAPTFVVEGQLLALQPQVAAGIEAAESQSFEAFLADYLSPARLG